MGQPDVDLTDKDYLWLTTIYDVLELVITHCGQAEDAQDRLTLGVNLKQAASAMECALRLFESLIKEKQT